LNDALLKANSHPLIPPLREVLAGPHPIPYRFEIRHRHGTLHVFGSPHFTTSQHPAFFAICRAAERCRPTLVAVEGTPEFHRSVPARARVELIARLGPISRERAMRYGESALGVKLALERGADAEHVTPTLRAQLAHLAAAGYAREYAFAYYLFRSIGMWTNFRHQRPLRDFIAWRVETLRAELPWDDIDADWQLARSIGEKVWGEASLENTDRYRDLVSPGVDPGSSRYTIMNEISHVSMHYVDCEVLERLVTLSRTERRILVIYGATHAARLEPALRCLLGMK
jgi:hypothetical protein